MQEPTPAPKPSNDGVAQKLFAADVPTDTLPLSMQLIGKAFDEATVFQVGDAYQRVTDYHLRIPTLARLAVAV